MLKLTILGNLGRDANLRTAKESGNPFYSLSVGCSDVNGKTTWIDVVYFGSDKLKEYLKKGAKIYAEGRFETTYYTDGNGSTQTAIKLFAEKLFLC